MKYFFALFLSLFSIISHSEDTTPKASLIHYQRIGDFLVKDAWFDLLDKNDGSPSTDFARFIYSCSNHKNVYVGYTNIKPRPDMKDFKETIDYVNRRFEMGNQSTQFIEAKVEPTDEDISKYCKNTSTTDFNIDALIASDNYGASYFARLNSIKKIGNNLEVWITRYKTIPISKNETTRVKSYLQLDLINCRDESKVTEKLVIYDEKGVLERSSVNKDIKLSRVSPDSIGEQLVKTVCKISGE